MTYPHIDPDLGGIRRAMAWTAPAWPQPFERLRAARERAGWSQRELAARLGCHRSTVGQLEAGITTAGRRIALRLTEVLGPGWDGGR